MNKYVSVIFALITLLITCHLYSLQTQHSENQRKLFLLESKTMRAHIKKASSKLTSDKKIIDDFEKESSAHMNDAALAVRGYKLTSQEDPWAVVNALWEKTHSELTRLDKSIDKFQFLLFLFSFLSVITSIFNKCKNDFKQSDSTLAT